MARIEPSAWAKAEAQRLTEACEDSEWSWVICDDHLAPALDAAWRAAAEAMKQQIMQHVYANNQTVDAIAAVPLPEPGEER